MIHPRGNLLKKVDWDNDVLWVDSEEDDDEDFYSDIYDPPFLYDDDDLYPW